MESKKSEPPLMGKLVYQRPAINAMKVELEQGIAAGSGVDAKGNVQQVWDNEETQTQSTSANWF